MDIQKIQSILVPYIGLPSWASHPDFDEVIGWGTFDIPINELEFNTCYKHLTSFIKKGEDRPKDSIEVIAFIPK